MKPYQILGFFLSVVLVLTMLSIIFPSGGVEVNDNISLKFIHINELFNEDTVEYADISEIINNTSVDEEFSAEQTEDEEVITEPDMLIPIDTIRANADSMKRITHLISFPGDDPSIMYGFFQRAASLRVNQRLLRILHYGDSQIEKDRITGYIRYKMQKSFGGSGCGLVPAVPLYDGKMSVKQSYSGGWVRITGFGKKDTTLNHNRFGALFTYAALNSTGEKEGEIEWLSFQPSPIAYSSARIFNKVSLFISKTVPEESQVKLFSNDSLLDVIEMRNATPYKMYSWEFEDTPPRIRFELYGDNSVNIYGVSLDNKWGIAVDNIPMRGSAGLEFSKTDTTLLKRMYSDLNVGLLILQFGGNVVPYMKNSSQYERYFRRELNIIKSLVPDVPVLVVGPSDMSEKVNGRYITYPNLEGVRNALRSAALSSNCAFWDMYEAMGGRNSMPSWVFAEPSLAVSDFVHFNSRGARIIGEMLYNSIIYEFDRWKNKTADKPITAGLSE